MQFYKTKVYKIKEDNNLEEIDNIVIRVGIGTIFGKVNELVTGTLINIIQKEDKINYDETTNNNLVVFKDDINNKVNYNDVNDYADNFEDSKFQKHLTEQYEKNKEKILKK